MAPTILSAHPVTPFARFVVGAQGSPPTETTCTLHLSADLSVVYPDASVDTLPALTPAAVVYGGTTWDRTALTWLGYTIKGSNVLSIVPESYLDALSGQVALLCRVTRTTIDPIPAVFAFNAPQGAPFPGGTNCAVFNGTDDWLGLASDLISGAGPFSVTVWLHSNSETDQCICGQITSATTVHDFVATLHFVTLFIQPLMLIGDSNGSDYHTQQGNNEVMITGWHHLAFVWSSDTSVNMYIDGVNQGLSNWSGSGGFTTENSGNFEVGSRQLGSPTDFFSGRMADLRVYPGALTGMQVAAIYAGGVTGYVPEGTPAAWWPFNDGSGGTAHNYGPDGGDLTWAGSGAHWAFI